MHDDTDDAAPQSAPPKPAKPRRNRPSAIALATLVAIIALAVGAWSLWSLQRETRTARSAHRQDAAAIAALQSQLAAGSQKAAAGDQRVAKLEAQLDDLRNADQGLDHRIANLETAYATLSGQQQSGHDAVLLNDAEMLLRTGAQRFNLFHDTNGALQAYGQAIAALAQVQNPAYAPVRASAEAERDALAAAAPPSRQTALDTLSALRSQVAALPLAATGPAPATSTAQKPGFFARLGHAFSGIVTVSREAGKTPTLAEAGFARQTLALDLAQAQEALLAFDDTAYRNALQSADAVLAKQFDGSAASVKTARSQIAHLLVQHASGPAPTLGGALAQLQSLRAAQSPALPATAATTAIPATSAVPAAASTAGAGKP